MKIEVVPLLHIAHELYQVPRGSERFQRYLATILNEAGDDVALLPLVAMNPMGREHVAARLAELIALEAEQVAAEAAAEAERRLPDAAGRWPLGLVVLDDLMGGWTNRFLMEGAALVARPARKPRDGWISVGWWVSEPPSVEGIRHSVLAAIFRRCYIERHGSAATLGDVLAQEQAVAHFADSRAPTLDADDLAYSRALLQGYLDSRHYPTLFACLFGDEAARSVGYPPMGLSPRAGLAVAVADAQAAAHPVRRTVGGGVPLLLRFL